MVATPAMAGKFGGGSSFSSSKSFSSGSSFRSSSFSSSSYRPTTTYRSSYQATRPAAVAAAPRFSSGSSYNTSRPAQSTVVNRSTASYGRPYGGNTYVNHNYGGGYGGGTFSSPWFWMWAMDRHQSPVYVNGGGGYAGAPMMGQPGYAAPAYGYDGGILGYIISVIVQIIILVLLIAVIWWAIRKFIFRK